MYCYEGGYGMKGEVHIFTYTYLDDANFFFMCFIIQYCTKIIVKYVNRIEVVKSHHTDMLAVGVFSRNSTYIRQSQPFAYIHIYMEI